MFRYLKSQCLTLFTPRPKPEYRTVDGGHLAPHPGMTDNDLREFERHFDVPNPTFQEPTHA